MPAAVDDPPEAWIRRRLATLAQKRAADESGIHTRVLRMTTPGEAQFARQKLAHLRAGQTKGPSSEAPPSKVEFEEAYAAKLLLSRLPLHEEPDAPDPDPILPLGREATAKRVALYEMAERTRVRLGDLELRERELSAADADGEGACLFASLLCAAARPEPAHRIEASHGRVQADVRHTLAESAAARAAAARVLSHTELAASRRLYDEEASGPELAAPAAATEEAVEQLARADEAEPPPSPARALRRAAQAQMKRATEAQQVAQAKAAAARAAAEESQAKAAAASQEAQEAKAASDAATIWAARATTDDAVAARAAAKAAATWAAEAAKAQAAAAQEAASARAQADAEVRAATQEAEEAAQAAQAAQAQVDAEDAAARAKAEAAAEAAAIAAAEAAARHDAAARVQAQVRARRASEERAARAEVVDHRALLQRSAALRSWAAAAGLADGDDEGQSTAPEDEAARGAASAEAPSAAAASTAHSEAAGLLGLGVPLLQQPAEASSSSREALPDMALLASQQLALSRQLCELAAGLGSEEDVVDG